jgi:hypothetical protein
MSDYKISDTLQQHYNKIFQDGKLINLHIGMWGMSYNLTEGDIKLDKQLPETIKLGKKMLIKPAVYNKFKNYEQKARKYLYDNSFVFPLGAQSHFVPKTKFVDVYKKLNELKAEYMEMVNEFVEKYEEYKQEVIEYYREHADTVSVDDLSSYYPPIAKIRDKFCFDIVSYEIALPTEFNELNLQDEIAREEANNEAKQKALEKYKTDYSEQLNVHTAKLSEFMTEVTSTVRGKVAEHFNVVLNKINKKELVSTVSINRIYKQIEEFRSVNFADDSVVEAELSKLEKLLDGKHDFEGNKDAIALLKTHLSNVVSAAESTSDVANVTGEYFRKLSA